MREVWSKSILNKNNMNIYRGCSHGCIYCDSRSQCYGMTDTFEDIEVKINAPQLLEEALSKKRNKCVITTGAMTDPYIPLEGTLKNMRQCLEIIERKGFGVAVLTKSDLILRDIDLLARINEKAKCVVQMTLTTFDEALCNKLEPHVATTKRRFEVLMEMKKTGIPTIVWMCPILPYINDSQENVEGLLAYCKEAGVKGILSFGAGMTLREGNREYFYQQLEHSFPEMKQRYSDTFGRAYGIRGPRSRKLERIISDFCKTNNMLHKTNDIFNYVSYLEPDGHQISLWE